MAMCAPVIQGYGLTETCAASFIGIPDDVVRQHDFCSDQEAQVTSICKRSSFCIYSQQGIYPAWHGSATARPYYSFALNKTASVASHQALFE